VRYLILLVLRAYRLAISPLLGPGKCRFHPTCSAYATGAVRVHGVLKGLLLAAWRLLRCQPLSRGGYDPVPPPHRWRP